MTYVDREQLLNSALAYAEAGWPIFPLRPGTKRPAFPNHTEATCDRSDRRCHDGHTGWEARATLDTDRIETAWRHRPYGIGIACGPAGLLVVDLDPAKGDQPSGSDSLEFLEGRAGHQLPATWTVGTPRGGRHLYYHRPDGQALGNTVGRLGPGMDTRGAGGYVVAPPTTTTGPDGGTYWLVDDHEPADLPHWFSQLLTAQARPDRRRPIPRSDQRQLHQIAGNDRARRYVTRAVAGELDRIAAAAEGQRNHTLFCAAIALGQLAATGLVDEHHAEQQLLDAASGHVAAGAYSHHQARQTITSGLRRGLAEPRQLPVGVAGR
ncbi:MAG: bifunctional DNA primase/polymerase [Actinomycetota bacterium]